MMIKASLSFLKKSERELRNSVFSGRGEWSISNNFWNISVKMYEIGTRTLLESLHDKPNLE